jgi:SAM-dependent methyltransferase
MTPMLGCLGGRRFGVDLVDTLQPGPGIHGVRATVEELPFSERYFDVVYCQSLVEHVQRPDLMFKEVARVLRPGGLFLLLTPNRWDYVSLAASLVPNDYHPALVKSLTGRPEQDTFPTLYRANTTSRLRRLAEENSFSIRRLDLCRQHPHYLQSNGLLYVAGVAFEQCVQRPIPWLRPWILGMFQLKPD